MDVPVGLLVSTFLVVVNSESSSLSSFSESSVPSRFFSCGVLDLFDRGRSLWRGGRTRTKGNH